MPVLSLYLSSYLGVSMAVFRPRLSVWCITNAGYLLLCLCYLVTRSHLYCVFSQ